MAKYWWVRTYNADGGPADSCGPYKSEAEAEWMAIRRQQFIDSAGWSCRVLVVADEQFIPSPSPDKEN
jgi:hypothetical protein